MAYLTSGNGCHFMGRMSRIQSIAEQQMGNKQDGTPNMVKVAKFTVAVPRKLTSQQRQANNVKDCDFVPFEATGSNAELIEKYFPVGKAVSILAQYREYQYKDSQSGETKYGHSFDVNAIDFVVNDAKSLQDGGNNNSGGTAQQNTGGGYGQPQNQPAPQTNPEVSNFSMFSSSTNPF